ncbi:MAG TPA: phosphotransferase, partial [Ktedonobacterales bacterium]|nr:phosphotransferase [Ktedonobacterales bacterium]
IAEPRAIARAINRLPRTLVHGDVWGPNMGWLPAIHGRPRLLLFDWALALAGPGTYDVLWQCGIWPTADPARMLAFYRARLARALWVRGHQLDDATWLALADAGYLRTVLTCGEGMARLALAAPVGTARQSALAWLRWWIERALRAADRLEGTG